jgi:hypothetical protein
MHAGADITGRLLWASVRRRLPVWAAVVLPWVVLASAPGLLAALAWIVWDALRLRAMVMRDWVRWLDGAVPALEDSSALLLHAASPVAKLQQQRLAERVATALTPSVVSRVAARRVRFDALWPALSIVAALLLWGLHLSPRAVPVSPAARALLAAQHSAIVVRVTPPKYTGVAATESAPRDLQVPQHSAIEWCPKEPLAADAPLELSDGQVLKLGRACARWQAEESLFWRWEGKRYNLRVVADQAPQVTISAPRDMLQVLAAGTSSAAIAVAVRDDYRIVRASMHMTLARGSGENIRFSDREVPLPVSTNPRERNWSKQWSLAELGMEPGDDLYFFVRASDNADPAHTTTSPTYTLRLPGPVATDDESTALPVLVKPENLRSQRQIIIDTEQLLADIKANRRLAPATVRARSEAIAGDQAMLRRRYGQFLGEESSLFGAEEHEEPGQKHDVVAEYGHAHDQAENATLFDEATKKILRRALTAMWDAEKSLRMITPQSALAPEYKALAAIKELQQADRIYLHKTAFAPPPLKEELRMTGDVVGTKSYKREQSGADEAMPPEVHSLLQALAADGALPALWSRTAHDWIRSRIQDDDQRLEAQRAVQDVADGCAACRPVLRAWLRGAIAQTPIVLQARGQVETPFTRAWRKGSAP